MHYTARRNIMRSMGLGILTGAVSTHPRYLQLGRWVRSTLSQATIANKGFHAMQLQVGTAPPCPPPSPSLPLRLFNPLMLPPSVLLNPIFRRWVYFLPSFLPSFRSNSLPSPPAGAGRMKQVEIVLSIIAILFSSRKVSASLIPG